MQSHTTPSLSILILAKDAGDTIEDTLASLAPCGGQIIVLDTGSHDQTATRAVNAGAQVIAHTWKDDFSEARNAALEHATGDWVLWIDAGETLPKLDVDRLREFLANDPDAGNAYQLFVTVPTEGGNVGGEQIARVRLHPRRRDLRFVGRVRETLLPALVETGLNLDRLEVHVNRGMREHEPLIKSSRARRNIKLAELEMEERGASAELWNCLGEAHQNLNEPAESAACYRQARQVAEAKSPEQLEALYGLLTALDSLGEDRQAQLALCMEALEHFPLDAQLLCAMGGYLQALGQDELAVRSYEVAFRHGLTEATVWHLPNIMELAASCRGAIMLLRDEAAALHAVEQGLEQHPDSPRLLRQRLDLLVRRGAKAEALQVLGQMRVQPPLREALETTIHGACLAVEQSWIAARAYLQTALKAGLSDALCFRWLTIAHLALGSDDEARTTMAAWEAFDPRNPEIRSFRQDPRLQLAEKVTSPTLRRIDPEQPVGETRSNSRSKARS